MANRLVIVGAGGHGKVCADCAESIGRWNEIVFVDRLYPGLKTCGAWHVVGENLEDIVQIGDDVFVAIGDNATRYKVFVEAVNGGFTLATLIHPSASVSKHANLGAGVLVCANATVCVDADIGDCSIINTAATLDHDCKLGKAVHVSPGANLAGEVVIGDYSWLGTGVSTKQQVEVGANVVVGVGAAIVQNCLEPGTYVGTPAKMFTGSRK